MSTKSAPYFRWFFALLVACVISLEVSGVYAQNDGDVLVRGNPPLTKGMAGKVIELLQWSLDIRFSEKQSYEIIQEITSYWQQGKTNEIKVITDIASAAEDLRGMDPDRRSKAREVIRSSLVKSMEQDKDDRLSRMVLEVYRSSRPNVFTPERDPVHPKVGTDGFTGIYVGTRNFASSINSVQMDYVTFLLDGNVYWTLPAEGLLFFDANAARRAASDDWGKYAKSGNTVRVSLSNGLEYVFEMAAGKLKLQPHSGTSAVRTYSRLGTGDGLQLSGTYRRSEGEPTITFLNEGRFVDAGIFRNFGTMSRPDGSTYQADGRGGSGTYLIAQNTLELRYSDGRTSRVAFTALPEVLLKKPVESFRINYEVFTRS